MCSSDLVKGKMINSIITCAGQKQNPCPGRLHRERGQKMSAEYSTAILNVIAGLGMFLYGMKLMGDGLQKVAGDKMRGNLETLRKTRFSALIVGIIFTGIIQSSNAATVMVVSFVNAGLMNLSQAIGVIFGANIGTTEIGRASCRERV